MTHVLEEVRRSVGVAAPFSLGKGILGVSGVLGVFGVLGLGPGCSKSDVADRRGDSADAEARNDDAVTSPTESSQTPQSPGFHYTPTFEKAVSSERDAVMVLEAEQRGQGELWIIAAEVRADAGGLGLDAYHFTPRAEDGVLEPEGPPVRLLSVEGQQNDDLLRAQLRRAFAVPQTRVVDAHAGHRAEVGDLTTAEALVSAIGERARVVADTDAAPRDRAAALAELMAMTKDGPFRRPEAIAAIVSAFQGQPKLERIEPGTESRLGMTIVLAPGQARVVLERRPGKQPTPLMVDTIE